MFLILSSSFTGAAFDKEEKIAIEILPVPAHEWKKERREVQFANTARFSPRLADTVPNIFKWWVMVQKARMYGHSWVCQEEEEKKRFGP